MIQLIVNRKTGYTYYRGESIQAAEAKWRVVKSNRCASWYEVEIKDTIFNNRG